MSINKPEILKEFSNQSLTIFGLLFICFGWLLFNTGLLLIWVEDEEYGHGMMVVGILLYLLYQNRNKLLLETSSKQWLGMVLSLGSLLMFLLGEISGIVPVQMYSIWLFAVAATLSIGGWPLFKKLIVPLGIIFLLIPLPNVLGPMLTSQLQLISSKLGVWVIRLFGGVVYLEGNVIDMGGVKLLVAEACAGLRYLFPLMSIGAIAGYLMRAPVWMRWSLFIATIPVTIFMNSFRIGVTGLLTEAYGTSHTEGFLHFFEGWVVFVASLIILIIFALLLAKLLPEKPKLIKVFSLDHVFDEKETTSSTEEKKWQSHNAVKIMLASLIIAVIASSPFTEREDNIISSKPFSSFPQILGKWKANEKRLPAAVIDSSDYYNGTFTSKEGKGINLYVAYYADQKFGPAPHSPELCIPGDGWKITSNEPYEIKNKQGRAIEVNRLIITKGDHTIITYYWLKQGSKTFIKQYMARLDLILFAIKESRADAALIRMVSEVSKSETMADTDARMQEMATELLDVISDYVPD